MPWQLNRRSSFVAAAIAVLIAAGLGTAYTLWQKPKLDPVVDLLERLPPGADSVFYLDLAPLRQSAFLAAIYKWAPQPQLDADYAQFVQSTGFRYERDLDRVGVGRYKDGPSTALFAIAEGRFDKKKVAAYALKTGSRSMRNGQEIFSLPGSAGGRQLSFTFLRQDRIAITNQLGGFDSGSSPRTPASEGQAWREHFLRLGGSPIFAVVRQSPGSSAGFAGAPVAGFSSPDFSALWSQLQWITVAAKPDEEQLRVVVDGEGSPQLNTLQMSDLLNGMLVFAEAGLNDPKLRAQLQPPVREAYLALLKSVDISRLDRGDSKSVRLVFEITPQFLEAVRPPAPGEPLSLVPKADSGKSRVRN